MISDNFLELIKDSIILYTKNKKLHKPVLLGHSMGGFIALWAAASAPGIFKKVISVDGLPYLPAISMPGSPVDTIKSMALMIKKSMSNQTPEQIEAGQRQYLPSMISNKDRIDQVIKMAVKANSNTQAEVMYEMFTIDLRKTVASIDCPVLLLGAWIAYKDYGATHDNVLKGYREQVSAIKDCKVELNDSAKHFIFYDAPKWFYERTDQFLGMKIPPGSQRKN